MTFKTTTALAVMLMAMILGATLEAAPQRNRDRDAAAAQPQSYGPKAATPEEQTAFAAITQTQDPIAKLAAADAFLAKYPMSQYAGYVNRFRMESLIATRKFKEAVAAGETGLAQESKFVEDLIKQADADAANKKRDKNAPPPIDKNSEAFKMFVAAHDQTQMYYYQNIMRAAQEDNDPNKVLEYGDKALAKMPGDVYSLITVSNVRARRIPSDDKEAEQALKRAEEVSKRAVTAVTTLVNGPNGAAMGEPQKAELLATVNISMGLVYFHQKKYEDAQKSYEAAVAAKKTDAEAYMLLGMAQANQRPPKIDQALDNLAKSVYLKGDTEKQARESLTSIYQATKKSLDGLDQFIQTAGSKIQQ